MKIAPLVISAAVVMLPCMHTIGQEIHFLPFDAAPVTLNPAYTGMFDGKVRASAMYHSQWSEVTVPYITYGIMVDLPVVTFSNGDYIAAGTQVVRDRAGDGDLVNFSALGSVAYHKVLGGRDSSKANHRCELALGVQAGYQNKSIDVENIYFGLFPLNFGRYVHLYPVNAGLSFSQSLSERFNYTIGVSARNMNQPDDPLMKKWFSDVGLDMAITEVIGANWLITKRLAIRPAVLRQDHAGYSYILLGSDFCYKVSKDGANRTVQSVFVGGWCRTRDILSITAGVDIKRVRIGVGFDSDVISIASSGRSGGVEVNLKYTGPSSASSRHKRVVACDRF